MGKEGHVKSKRRAILFSAGLFPFMLNIALIDFLIPIKYDVVLENLPLFGLLVTLAWLGSSFLNLVVGDMTDRIGVKKTIQLGVLLSFAGALLFALSSNFIIMTLSVFLWGLSYVMLAVPADTYMFSAFPKGYIGSAYGLFYCFHDMAYAFAPLIGYAIISLFGINSAIVSAAMISLLTIPMIYRLKSRSREGVLKAIEDIVEKDGIIKKELKDLKKINLKEFSLLFNMFLFGLWFMTIMIGSPLLFFHETHTNLLKGALLAFAFMMPFAVMDLVYGKMANSPSRRKLMINYGFIFSAVFLVVFFFTQNFLALLGTAMLITISTQMAWTASEVQVSEYLPRGRKGEFMGIFITARDLGYDLAPLFYGIFAYLGLKLPFMVLGALIIAGWILFLVAWRNDK